MKRCPACGRTFTNNTLINCLNDGTTLVEDTPAPPPYFGAPPVAAAPAEAPPPPPPASPSEAPASVTYTNTPLSAIPELQSPEMQAALKEALDKAGMSSLFGADLSGKSTISVTTSTTTRGPETPFAYGQTPQGNPALPPAFAGASPYYAGVSDPRRKRSPLRGWIVAILIAFAVFSGIRYIVHRAATSLSANTAVPAGIVAAVKNADDAEIKAVGRLDSHPLASAYAGPALAHELSEVAALKSAHRTQEDHLKAQEFSEFKPSADGNKAQVDVTETWDTTTYSEPGHTEISQKSGDVNPQTVYLTRSPGGWVVEKIVFHHS